MRLTAFFLVLFHGEAQAAQLVPQWSFEKSGDRRYALEYLQPIGGPMLAKVELGGWISRSPDRRSSLYGSVSWGYRVEEPLLGGFAEAFIGPAWAANLDRHTSSHFQIAHDVAVGFGREGWGISVGFRHLSNAGVVPPNLGRDFVGVRFLIGL